MKAKRSIRQKILIYILTSFSAFYLISVGYIVINSRKTILNETLQKNELLGTNSASEVEKFFEKNITLTRTLSQAFSIYQTMPADKWQKLFTDMYFPIIKKNPSVSIIWDSWEYKGFIPGYEKEHGRTANMVKFDGKNFVLITQERSLDGDPNLYAEFKKNNIDDIWEPYLDELVTEGYVAQLMTTIGSPIQVSGKYMGLVGLDVELKSLQELVKNIKTVEGGYAFLISHTGIIAGHPDDALIFKNIADAYPDETEKQSLLQRIQKGEMFSYVKMDNDNNSHYLFFSPITIEGINRNWSLVLSIPYSQIMRVANRSLFISLGVGFVALLFIVVLLLVISNNLTRPIKRMTESLKRMSNGEISKQMIFDVDSGDEIQEMAEAFRQSIEGLNKKTSFALDIGIGKLDSKLELLGDKDILGKSLIDMRDSLSKAQKEEAIRKAEDQKRAWANEGLAKFADILRHNNDNIEVLCDEVLRNLVKYLNANQAGLFLLNDDDKNSKFFELVSAYAWDRKKFVNKKFDITEGLVGACALEKDTIQLTEVPDDYVEITSGLGKATPKYIVLVPLKHEEEVLGVIELASFKKLEQFEVDFLEKVAQSIASTILSVRINAKTKYLLEQSQQQAEEMLAQEEEMRQNMEELQATQEEMARKAEELKSKEDDIRNHYENEIEILKRQIWELEQKK